MDTCPTTEESEACAGTNIWINREEVGGSYRQSLRTEKEAWSKSQAGAVNGPTARRQANRLTPICSASACGL